MLKPMFLARMVLGAILVALAFPSVAGEGTLTIVGTGKGPVRIVEKDGTVTQVDPQSLPINIQRTNPSSTPSRPAVETPGEPSENPSEPDTPKTAEQKAAEQLKAEAARAAQVAQAAAEAKRAKAKEAANYNDKEYVYGPGTANNVDRTGQVLQRRDAGRSKMQEDRPKAEIIRNETPKPAAAPAAAEPESVAE